MAAPGLLVISDSQWKYAVPEVQEFGEFDVSVIPVSGMQVHQVDSTMLLATEFFNDTVVHLGTNNLICGETPERVVEHQQELLTRIRLRNPKVRLFLSSVLKRRVNYFKSWTLQRNLYIEEMNLKIDKLNMLMKQLALRMNVVFIDNWREFEAQSQDPFEFFLGRDGLHLSRRGLRVLTGNVYRACLQARRDYPRSLACLPPAPSPASSSAPSPGHHPLPSPSFSDGAGMNASLPSFSYSDALCSNLPLHNDLMQVSSFQPSVRPLHLPSVTRTNASSYSSPPLSPSSSTPSCFKFTTVTRRGNHHCNKPKIVPKHSSSFKIPLNNRWSSLSSLNDSFMPSFSSVANCTKKQSCIKKKSISPKMFPSSAFCRPSSLPLISDVRNTNKDGTTKEFPARLCRQIGFKLKNPLTDRLTIKIQNGGSSEGKLDIHSTLYPRKCPNCNKVYANKSSFCHHKATCLRIEKSDSNISYPRVCQICLVSYSNKCNYSRHKKTCNEKSQYIVCPHDGCNVKFQSHSILICHLQSVHQEDICVEDHEFKDMFDFNAWKTSQCQLNYMSLVKHNGERVNRGKRFMYFICKFNNHHKNGIVSNKTNRKRKFGRMPNSDCIARMLVNESESGVSVKYVNAHNHDLEFKNVKFYRWDNATKYKINSLLEQSVPAHKIQEYFQPADPSLNEMLPLKEHFITSTQINKMKYDLNSKKHLSDDDAVAVDLLVHLMKDESKDSILVYKPMGSGTIIGNKGLDNLPHASELFVLGIQQKLQLKEMIEGCGRILCIDSTHGTNQYKFHLLNLIVPDEYGVGYPVAHFITSHLDEETLTYLLQSIMDRSPDLHVNAIMTDGDEALGNAVRRVFGHKTKHLLCLWHVKRNWHKNLHQKVKNKELITEVNEVLETLIEEKNDTVFNAMLNSFLAKYSDQAGEFTKYFKDYYCSKKEKWAMCYRNFPHAATDTNMFVESFHNKLKSHYLNRKVNRRLDDLIQVLLTIHKTVHLGLAYKRMSKKPPLGFQNSYNNDHMKGLKISDDEIFSTSDENVWHVKSQNDQSTIYTVENISQNCLYPDLCFIRCNEFSCQDLCCHLYTCSCPNNYALCKHVHKVHSFVVRNRPTPAPMHETILNFPPDKLFKSVSTSKDCKLEHINVQHSHAIGQHLDKLKILSQQCSPVLLPYISKSLKLLVETCQGAIECNQSNSTLGTLSAHDVPPNAKLSPQLKLHPAIKKRRPMVNLFKRPGYVRRKDIKISLLSNEVSSFTEPIVDVASLSMEVCKVGSFSVKMYELKSLDFLIPPEEVSAIRKVFPDFKRGWLYDTIIAAFLWKIAESVPSVFSVDPVISQYVTGKISQSRPMAIFGKSDLSCVTRIVIPLNVCNSHWMLIVALPLERKLEFYDPAADVIHHTNNFAIQRWIKVLSVSFGCTERDWEVSSPEHFKQRDSHNCGVFICWYAERIIQGRLIKEPFDADKYRKYMFDMITVLDN
ncbi:uncharacterized protein LOC124154490 [Ischnura elegans]|uniref:uncharacterized protein LOC124154490 n=1 Tax=Ischnura elegans TaxID=197161 RepID=UPI001ED8AC42|nr:uncharacterized protein LOC124154490 [Ischnura elegans]